MRKTEKRRVKSIRKLFRSIGGKYEEVQFYESLGTQYESWIETYTVLSDLQYLKSDPNKRVLDIGIGSARISKKIVRKGYKIIGIDIVPEMLKHSSEVLHKMGHGRKCNFVLSSMSHLPFKENCFDAIICIRTLKYASHPSDVLLDAHRVLKQGGIFVVGFPNIKTYYSLLILFDKLTRRRKLLVKYFVLNDMVNYVRTLGFEILGIKETLILPRAFYVKIHRERVLAAAISIERALSWLLPKRILARSFIMACARMH